MPNHFKNHFNRFINLVSWIYKTALLLLVAKKNHIVLVPEFTVNTGTYTYFLNVLDFLCCKGFKVIILIHRQHENDINKLLSNYAFTPVFYEKELVHFQFYANLRSLQILYFIDKFLPETHFFLNVMLRYRARHLFISSQYPGHFFASLLLPAKKYYVVHAMLWGPLDAGNHLLLKLGIKNGLQILTVSDAARDAITHFWGTATTAKINVIPNFFKAAGKVNNTNINLKDPKIVLCIGTLDKNKNPAFFIALAQKSFAIYGNAVQFYWAGTGALWQFCKDAEGGQSNLHFKGISEDVDSLYQTAYLYLQLSITESQGIAILGAMHYGLPCIVTNGGGAKECVIDGENGFVVDTTKEELVFSKLALLLENEPLAKRMGDKGKIILEKKASNQCWTNKMQRVLKI